MAGKLSVKTRLLNVIRKIFLTFAGEKNLLFLSMNRPLGCWTSRFLPNCYQFPKNSIRNVTREGLNFRLDLSDFVQWVIFFGFRTMEPLLGLVKKGDIIIDAGANIGYTALKMGQITGEHGKIFAFEPVPSTYKLLDLHLDINNRPKNIFAFNLGLSNQKEQLFIVEAEENNIGMNHISSDKGDSQAGIAVNCLTIDEWQSQEQLNRLDLIKIDVEGFEYHVLLGAKETLKRFKPTLFVELDDRNIARYGKSYIDLLLFLSELGYQIYEADTKRPINAETKLLNYHNDIIAFHPDRKPSGF